MGYGVMAWAVDIDQLTALVGSGDDARRRSICGRFRQDITRTSNVEALKSGTGEELQTIARWLVQASAERRGIVGFYY